MFSYRLWTKKAERLMLRSYDVSIMESKNSLVQQEI